MAENRTVCAQVASLAPPQLELAPQFLCYMMMVVVMTLMTIVTRRQDDDDGWCSSHAMPDSNLDAPMSIISPQCPQTALTAPSHFRTLFHHTAVPIVCCITHRLPRYPSRQCPSDPRLAANSTYHIIGGAPPHTHNVMLQTIHCCNTMI